MIYDYIVIGSGFGGSLVYANTLSFPPDGFFNNLEWHRLGDWKKKLEPFYDRASFMLGRKKYSKLNIEDKLLEEVSNEMNAHDTFETAFVGVNIDGSVIQGNIGVNPSLTITAMAEYSMNWIPSKDGGGVTDISKQLILLEEEWKKNRSA